MSKKPSQSVTWHDGIRQVHRAACEEDGPGCGCPFFVPERFPDGRRRWQRVEDFEEAGVIKGEFDAALARARYEGVYEKVTLATVEQAVGHTLRQKKGVLKPSTFSSYEDSARRHVLGETDDEVDRFGIRYLPLEQFDVDAAEAWLNQLVATLGTNHTSYKAFQILRIVLNDAVGRRKMTYNPLVSIKFPRAQLPKSKRARDRRLTRQQVRQLIDACDLARHRLLVRVAVEGCLRRGELAGLQFRDFGSVQRNGKTIWFFRIERSISQNKFTGGEKHVLSPKSDVGRAVVISADLAAEFQLYFEWEQHASGATSTSFVWPGKNGRGGRIDNNIPTSLYPLGTTIIRLCTRAGLVDGDGNPLTSLHGLRATGATLAAEAGVEPFVIQRQLGHTDLRVTQDSYLDLSAPEFLAEFTRGFERDGSSG